MLETYRKVASWLPTAGRGSEKIFNNHLLIGQHYLSQASKLGLQLGTQSKYFPSTQSLEVQYSLMTEDNQVAIFDVWFLEKGGARYLIKSDRAIDYRDSFVQYLANGKLDAKALKLARKEYTEWLI